MKVPKIFTAIAAAAMLLVANANVSAAPTNGYVEGIDWTKQVITVTGEGIVPKNAVNYTQAKHLAATAAKADAYRKLGEIVNGVRVEGETTIEKMLTTADVIKMRVSATIKGAKVISENFMSDGSYRVVVQVPLFGVSNSLAGAVFEKNTNVEPFPEPVAGIEPSIPQYDSNTPVNRRIEITSQTKITVEENFTPPPTTYRPPLSRLSASTLDGIILQKMQVRTGSLATYDTTKAAKRPVTEYAATAQGDFTGLIVDCRGLQLQPVMSPVISNSNGTKIYGHKNLDIDKVISMGMVDYASDNSLVGRAGSNPLVVKAISTKNFNSNPVINIPDSNRVLIENYATKFLRDLKVVFLFD